MTMTIDADEDAVKVDNDEDTCWKTMYLFDNTKAHHQLGTIASMLQIWLSIVVPTR